MSIFDIFKPKAKQSPTVLLILDGWGYANPWGGNAISMAETPNFESLAQKYPFFTLEASAGAVGLPTNLPGNSEVGHMAIGSGQAIMQHLTIIDNAIADGSFFQNTFLLKAMQTAKERQSRVHILGMMSKGSLVHGNIDHVFALVQMAKDNGLSEVYVHGFSDGRDAPQTESLQQTHRLIEKMNQLGVGKIATITGRYYSMDRNKRWERTQKTYEAMIEGKGETSFDPEEVYAKNYSKDITDEYIPPTVIINSDGSPVATIKDGDVVIFANFRSDRTRQLSYALANADFDDFKRNVWPKIYFVSMVFYSMKLPENVAFRLKSEGDCLAKVISDAGLKQYHLAETQKYPHVTFFINGGREDVFSGEERGLIASIEGITYDRVPRMSVDKVADNLIDKINSNLFDAYIVNFANADMVGHTGDLPATIEACEAVDENIGRVWEAVKNKNGTLLIVADHGNAEEKVDIKTGRPNPEHTKNPVPFIVADSRGRFAARINLPEDYDKQLRDVAPTMLEVMALPIGKGMTGTSLVLRKN